MSKFDFKGMITQNNQVKELPIGMLVSYHNHQFKLYSGERFEDMVESVRRNGILNPILVQPINGGAEYEILSGHNRVESARRVGLEYIPAIVKENLSEEEAEMYVIETNLIQRSFSELLVSEQASIIDYRYSKMFSQGKRNDIVNEINRLEGIKTTCGPVGHKLVEELDTTRGEACHRSGEESESTCGPVGHKLKSREALAKEYSLSPRTIARLLRINYLVQPLKDMVDEKAISIRVGIELSYLPQEWQQTVYGAISASGVRLDVKRAKAIRSLFGGDTVPTREAVEAIVLDSKRSKGVRHVKVPLNRDVYSRYFDGGVSTDEVADILQKALEAYFDHDRRSE